MKVIKQPIKKTEIQNVVISKSNQFMRDWVTSFSHFYNTPDTLMEKLKEEIVAKRKVEGLSKDFHKNLIEAGFALGLSTHMPVAKTVREEYSTFLVEMIRDIEREYNCKTATEKALAEMIASSYVRTIQYSKELTLCTIDKDLSHEKNGYYSILGKELDRANRNFLNASMTLKQLKNPLLDINIKTKNAFIGQNQQFNNNQNTNND